MFDFFSMKDNYEQRAVSRYEDSVMVIDTAAVDDGSQPYETGISHPEYNDGLWIIVEAYATYHQAIQGHDRWVAKMTSDELPESLKDCKNADIVRVFSEIVGDMEYKRTPRDG